MKDDECTGCKYEYNPDIEVVLGICTYCKRAYGRKEDRDMHEDKYEKNQGGI